MIPESFSMMGKKMFKRSWGIIMLLLLGTVSGNLMAQEQLFSDSSLSVFSVEDLVKIRQLLSRERERLLGSQEKIREQGVEVTKEFLDKTKDENSNQDKILIRVAEYYIEEEDLVHEKRFDDYEKQYEAYEREQKAFEAGQLKTTPVEPQIPRRNYEKAIAIYDLIIANFPESDLVDDAYYNKAFLLDEMEEKNSAQEIFQAIIDEFPESAYAPEAYMKLAETYFYPEPGDSVQQTILKLNKAIQLYKNVLQYKESPRYDEALYKLGWSYYRLAGENSDAYTDAILYFLAVVRDIEKVKDLDPTGEIVRADVKPEALQFIAASFIDPNYQNSGVDMAKTFLEKLDRPRYGIDIMENMGDRYAKITKWQDAISSYYELLDMYPDYPYAPSIKKKIADAYIADEQFERAFEERNLLFENYNPKSEWYAQLEQSQSNQRLVAMDDAYRITEEAFRTNITYIYTIANQQESDSSLVAARQLYEEFVGLCKRYLDNYPTDENAYEINWAYAYVLDTKLGRFEEAFAEYIRVSNDYLENGHQLDAAVNAINTADTLVKISKTLEDPTQLSIERSAPQLQVAELTPEEKMLAEAYDNFIKLFPNSTETPSVLAAAGALYYNHRQYDLAKKYYKTMVTKFPKAQQKSIGLVSLMNSYFFLGQYRDAEIVAKKILDSPDIPTDQIEIAKSRIGESIFKNGERLEQEGSYIDAAREYRRVFEEASEYVEFVDLSLFRSSRNFEEADEWLKAIETYELLVEGYPESEYVLDALNNIAADYKEMEDYINVAKTNERIFERFPGTQEAENALFNSSLFFAKAEAWGEAIRTNNIYIQNYPDNAESRELLFENAKYYLKLDDLASANRIYEEFATLYPNDPLTIEAFFNRGNYYFERSRYDSAKTEFNKAISRSDQFARAGRDPNLFYAAEANFKLGSILYKEYNDIQLSYPQSALRGQLERKQSKLGEVQGAFTNVISLGSVRSFEAMYRIAEAYEGFADAISNQQLPPDLSLEQRLVEEDQVFKASVPAYDRAVQEYKNVMLNLPKLAEKLEVSMDTTDVAPSEPEPVVADSADAIVQKEVEADSSTEVALKWYGRATEKISLIQYNVADRSSEFITKYLRVENPNQGLKALVFKDQVLRKLVAPQVNTTIEAHLKNIQVSDELNLENQYVEESKRKILLARNTLAEEYERLTYENLRIYQNSMSTLENLILQGEGATTPDGMDYYDYHDSYVMQLIFLMNQYGKIALSQYKATLQLAGQNNINNDARLTTEQKMFNFGYEVGTKMTEVADKPFKKSEEMIARYDSTENENYQLGSTFFDDQHFELTSQAQDIHSFAYDISKEFEIENIWTQLTLVKLVEVDPVRYVEDLPREEVIVQSDSTWLATSQYSQNWNLLEFGDAGWESAKVLAVDFDEISPIFDSLQVAPPSIWYSRYLASQNTGIIGNPLDFEDRTLQDSTLQDGGSSLTNFSLSDSTANDTSSQFTLGTEVEPDSVTAYFRKSFELKSKPIEGWLAVAGDQKFRIFLNDIYLLGVDEDGFQNVQVLNFTTFAEFLVDGKNLITASVTDPDGVPRNGLKFYLSLRLLPGEINETISRIRNQVQPRDIQPEQLRRSGVTNKNRVVSE